MGFAARSCFCTTRAFTPAQPAEADFPSSLIRSQRAVENIGGVPAGSRRDGSGRRSLAYRIDARTWTDVMA